MGSFFPSILLLYYLFFLVKTWRDGKRQSFIFNPLSRGKVYLAMVATDVAATLICLYIAVLESSFLIGRSVILFLAHLTWTWMLMGDFVGENDTSWGVIGRPLCFALGLYWFYLAIGPGISFVEIMEALED